MPQEKSKYDEIEEKGSGQHSQHFWARVDAVCLVILDNDRYLQSKRSAELTAKIVKKFGVSERQAQRYISAAKREVRRIGKAKRDKAFLKAIRDREYLLQKAKSTEDYKLALEILKDRDKLQGLYVDKVEHSGEVTHKNIDLSRFTEHGLERIKRGDPIEDVLMDPEAVKND